MPEYYDVVLALIPLSILGITGTLFAAGLSLTTAVPLAAAVAAIVVGHAMFINTPTAAPDHTDATPPRPAD